MRIEPGVEALAGDFALEHHRVGDGAVGAVGIGHAVQRDGHLVEVALGIDADGFNELLVLRHTLGRLQVPMEKGADGLKVDVEDAVGLGQQARGLGRRFGAQKNGHGQQNQDCGDDEKRSARASVHAFGDEEPSAMSVTLPVGIGPV